MPLDTVPTGSVPIVPVPVPNTEMPVGSVERRNVGKE